MKREKEKQWNTYGYVRLSIEDGDKRESDSIKSQKELIQDFVSLHPECALKGFKTDDGFTGSNFERPAFREMITEVLAGTVDCIIVKDLSRFGRNYLETGEYIERIFPLRGVRFIAINDHLDTIQGLTDSDALIVPFKNLMNESYCRDISKKVRSNLELKRKQGQFVGAFPCFGYRKSEQDKHRLEIDEPAAEVVRQVFTWALEGYSLRHIADRLNREGVLSPIGYKHSLGFEQHTSFQKEGSSQWWSTTVRRILTNPVYLGILEQGKTRKLSFKVKKVVRQSPENWAVVSGKHEAIIDPVDFETVQRALCLDTRAGKDQAQVDPFSGLLYCGCCGANLRFQLIRKNPKRYRYYKCRANGREGHPLISIPVEILEQIAIQSIRNKIEETIDLTQLLDTLQPSLLQSARIFRLQKQLQIKEEDIKRQQALIASLYKSLIQKIIDQMEYTQLKSEFEDKRGKMERQAETLRETLEQCRTKQNDREAWMNEVLQYQGIRTLDRRCVVTFIDRIRVLPDKRVELIFRWADDK